ncbi:MAG: ThiF family adenylyltransferase [Candidatus Pacebacteria bacterium]|nr:ThiF family adenylyltransferase [Candidatus Paceibacterota bacterium]
MIDYWRQLGIISADDIGAVKVVVIGAGGIGSPTILALAKMGIGGITVYDDDTVENHNLPNQFYRLNDIGKTKVGAIKDACMEYAGLTVRGEIERVTNQSLVGPVISGVDSMESRRRVWQEAIKYNPNVPIYIDGRMGGQICRIYTVHPCDPDSVEWYEGTLYGEGQTKELPCTERAIIYNSFMIASLIANQVKKFAGAESTAREIVFDLQTLTFLVKE